MIRAALVVAIAIAAAPSDGDACSCMARAPACEEYQQTPVVFVGKVTAIVDGAGGSQQVTLAVSEKLKGTVEATETVEGGGLCGTVFQKGKTYVVYASGASGRLSSGLCGRTATLDKAREDLAYIRSLPARTKGIVEGHVLVDDTARTPRVGVEVRARGTRHRARTDRTGRYALELPPGSYTLEVVDAKTLAQTETIDVADKHACKTRDVLVAWNGRVRGRLLGADGKPAANVELTLFGIGATRSGHRFATTDAAGKYEFSGLPSGEYAVVAYSAKLVPTTTYYPNVSESAQAKPIKLSQSGVVQLRDLVLLP